MFGSSQNMAQPKQRPLGVDERRSATNEEARPVPWFCGKQRLGVTFISDVFNQKTVAVTATVGKQKTRTGYNYYASISALAGLGPVDGFHDIYLNGDSVYASDVKLQALALTSAAGAATFKTKNAHGRTTGEEVIIEGANQGDYNGSAIITVISATEFTYPILGTLVTPATGNITAKVKLDPILRADNPDPVDILIPDYGPSVFYWGTDDQPSDAILAESGITHPPYRRMSKITFDQLFMGFNQTNVQNIELTLSRQPTAAWHALGAIDGDANPIAAICDLLQNSFVGLGISDDDINQALMIAAGEQLSEEGLGISPFADRQQDAAQILALMLDHIDASLMQDEDGKLFVQLNRAPEVIDVAITDADTTERVSFTPADWSTAFALTEIKFSNRERAYKEDIVRYRANEVFAITGQRTKKTLDLPFITSRRVALALVQSAGRANALPELTGTARLRKSGTLFDDLAPGSLFTFDLSTRDTSGLAFRVVDRTLPDSARPEFSITFAVDRSYLYTAPGNVDLGPGAVLGVGGEEIQGVGGETIEGV